MATVGEQLKTAREAQRLPVHRVAEVTRMRTDQVLAIEAGNHSAFVAPVYLRGFVRAYARFVRVDEAAILAQLDQESGRPGQPVRPARPADEGEGGRPDLLERLSRIRWQTLGPVIAGVLVAVFGFLLIRSSRDQTGIPSADFSPALYEPGPRGAGEVLRLPDGPEVRE